MREQLTRRLGWLCTFCRVQEKRSETWLLFWAIFAHKLVMSFSLVAKFLAANVSNVQTILLLTLFSLVTPVGTLVGSYALESAGGSAVTVMHCLTVGAFLYIGTVDVCPHTGPTLFPGLSIRNSHGFANCSDSRESDQDTQGFLTLYESPCY